MLLVGDYNNSNIDIESLTEDRNNILLYEQYKNLIDELVIMTKTWNLNFAIGFGGITEIEWDQLEILCFIL